ncbi:DUF222 domain-containing protein [Microbacterium sp. RD1]|uniref:HNH endonuclease signature motif containing protein n=1 Tax=Microbacterium sp. RD1 TaxID=3457313 RepID=UPI003FA54775
MDTFPIPGGIDPEQAVRMRAALAGVLSEDAVIAAAQAKRVRHLAALMTEAMTQMEVSGSAVREMPVRSIAAEVAFAAHMPDRTAQRELDDAYTLVTRFPRTVEVWEAGRISRGHAAIILKTGLPLPDEVRAAWEETVLEFAVKETPGRTDAYARELAEIINPVSMAERHAEAVTKRSISVVDLADGMALLQVLLPATIAYAIRDRIRQQAKIVRDTANAHRARRRTESAGPRVDGTVTEPADGAVVDDVRTTAQISADLVADMLLCATPTIDPTGNAALDRITGHVQITIPATALTGMTESGAMLNGRTPVDPDTARRLAGGTPGWDRVFTHPITGIVIAVDRYTPAASQARFLRARDRRCRGYGCRQPAHRCQIDHNHEHHDGGETTNTNLAHFCTRHHTLKTETPWTATQHPNGTLQFRSPLGHTYTDQPPPHVTFIPDNQPPPF